MTDESPCCGERDESPCCGEGWAREGIFGAAARNLLSFDPIHSAQQCELYRHGLLKEREQIRECVELLVAMEQLIPCGAERHVGRVLGTFS